VQSSGAVGQLPGNEQYFMHHPCVRRGAWAHLFWRNKHGKHPYRPRHRRRLRPPARAALFAGVAGADNGAFADDGSSAAVTNAAQGLIGSGVGGDNFGTSSTTQQQATGSGASNQSNTAQVNGSAFTAVDQGDDNASVNFTPLWW
jgi:hypothetical protein